MGVPAMIGILAFVAFAPKLNGLGLLVGAVAVGLVQLVIGAAIRLGEPRRTEGDQRPSSLR